jgi:HPt (histidine-containing phosphotransfer) domain-containing protein
MHPSKTPCNEPRVDAAIDPGIYGSLAETMDGEMTELVADFIASTSDLLTALAAAEANGDLPNVKLHTHSIKSSAAVVGAVRLSELARALEATAGSGPFDGVVHSSAAIHDEFTRVTHELGRLAGTVR